jgi:type I restriction enzyme S subunit
MRVPTPHTAIAPWPSRPASALFDRVRRQARPIDDVVTAFRDGEVTLRKNRRVDGFTNAVEEIGYHGIRRGDLVVHSMDGFAGAIGVSDSDGKASPVVHAYRARPAIDSRYYAYLLRDLAACGFVVSLAKGIRERSTAFDAETFRSLVLPVPDEDSQREIADHLDAETTRIDGLIAKKGRLSESCRERFGAFRSTRLLRGFNPVDGSGTLPPGWRTPTLAMCVSIQRGHDLPDQARRVGDVPVVSSGGVSGWHDAAAATGPGVVTGRYGTIGEVYYIEGPYWPLNTTLYVKDFFGNDPRWVFHTLSALPLAAESAKSAVTGINRNVIGMLRVPLPPIDEQKRLAVEVDLAWQATDEVVSRIKSQIALLRERREALITAAVTGQLDIPGVAA